MKSILFVAVTFLLAPAAVAQTWGTVEFQNTRLKPLKITIVQVSKARTAGTLILENSQGVKTSVGLSAAQLRSVKSWLRVHYTRELELRNQRKERVNCAKRAGLLNIEPGILTVPLCAGIARHQSLAIATGLFFQKFFENRAVASLGH